MANNVWSDDIGRCFCDKHRRDHCNECCLDFTKANEVMEVQAGLRKKPTRAQELAEEKVLLERGIDFMMTQDPRTRESMRENLEYHRNELTRVDRELTELERQGQASKINEALDKELTKARTNDAERNALCRAFQQENPGVTRMEIGGAEHQRLHEKYVAAPPSANRDQSVDQFTCSYCQKHSSKKFPCCARCKKQAYCSKECQSAHWKAHKKECIKMDKLSKEDNVRLPLTWEQLEEFGVAEGRKLEVRLLEIEPGMRLVAQCKDRAGICKRVAAYTNSRDIPGFRPGKVMKWKNPRFHLFKNGSSGARIEEEDLQNITIVGN